MNQIVDLRVQTSAAVAANQALSSQIKDKYKTLSSKLSADDIAKIKATAQQNKDLATQAKNLNTQRQELKKEYNAAINARDTVTMKTLTPKILDLSNQINTIRQQIQTNIAQIKPLRDQAKAYSDAIKAKKAQLQPSIQQEKDIHTKIINEQKAKDALWQTFSANIKAKDYTAAGNTLQLIINAKTQIISDIKNRGVILTNILNTFN